MQVNSITVNAAELNAGRGMIGIGAAGISGVAGDGTSLSEQSQRGNNSFGPSYKVTISEEGKALSRQQGVKQEKESQSADIARAEKMLLRLSRAEEDVKSACDDLRQELNDIERQILAINTSTVKKSKIENDPAAKEAMEQLSELQDALKRQREYQMEESQRLAKEAGLSNMRSGRYQEEIDENNRELVTLLKTIEEAEKAEERQEGGTAETGLGSDNGAKVESVEVSPFQKEANHFMTSTVRQEFAIDDMFSGLNDTADWFINTANSVTQSVMERSAGIRAAMEDAAFSDEEIAGMVEELRGEMPSNYQTVGDYRGFGLYLKGVLRTEKINHMGDNPMRAVKEANKAALQATAAAALGEASQSVLDGASEELSDEVKELIERRNDPGRAAKEEESQSGIKAVFNEPTEEKMAAAKKLMEEIGTPDFRITPDASKIHDLLQVADVRKYER